MSRIITAAVIAVAVASRFSASAAEPPARRTYRIFVTDSGRQGITVVPDEPQPPQPEWQQCLDRLGSNTAALAKSLSADEISDLQKSIDWMKDIQTKHPREAMHYRQWLPCNGGFVRDWRLNAGAIRPENYAGMLGYDSPLGTCHDATTFSRRITEGGFDSQFPRLWPLLNNHATRQPDGSVTGWVIYNGHAFIATLADPSCTTSCVAKFDRPCSLPNESDDMSWTWFVDVNGNYQVTRWRGGDTSRPDPLTGNE